MNTPRSAIIIGAGFGGLGLAVLLAKQGCHVTVLEKNAKVGGRANVYEADGFVFDMGPSWYMMPDIFEHFFTLAGEDIRDHLELERLSPSYRIFLKSTRQHYDFYSDLEKTIATFESIEPGSGAVLREYMATTEYQYRIAREEFMFKNYDSIFDFLNRRVMTEGRKLPLFSKVDRIIDRKFKSEILRKVMKYQTVLLGTAPGNTPGIYSMMNYIDFVEGVWYPKGGIYKVVEALERIARKHGVRITTNAAVAEIVVENQTAVGVRLSDGSEQRADVVISNADIEHTDQRLLAPQFRERTPAYWNSRVMAPSAFILYLGVRGRIPSLTHHNLLFSENWQHNFRQIFESPAWPDDPSLYICAPSVTDPTVAPPDTENLFVLVPVAAGLEATAAFIAEYKQKILTDMETYLNIPDLRSRIIHERVYEVKDFKRDYHAFKGTALGLAHNLSQTAIFRPNNVNRNVANLFYVGAGTNPGIGMPICLISAELAYKRIMGIADPAPLQSLE